MTPTDVTDQNRATGPNARVAANVRAAVRANLWTQRHLCLVLGVSKMTVSRKYRGLTPWTVAELAQLAPALGTTPEQLVAGVAA